MSTPQPPSPSFSDPELSSGSQHEHKTRQRNSRACDQCRKLRVRCIRAARGGPCVSCSHRQLDCTSDGPDHKRGPPRGYLHALENRLQGAEAILGVLISIPDWSLQHIFSLMQTDPQAHEILSTVNHGAFGPSGRKLRAWLIDAVNNSENQAEFKRHTRLGLANDTADPLVTRKTNIWQDQLFRLICDQTPNLNGLSPIEPASLSPQSAQASCSAGPSESSQTTWVKVEKSPYSISTPLSGLEESYSSGGSEEHFQQPRQQPQLHPQQPLPYPPPPRPL